MAVARRPPTNVQDTTQRRAKRKGGGDQKQIQRTLLSDRPEHTPHTHSTPVSLTQSITPARTQFTPAGRRTLSPWTTAPPPARIFSTSAGASGPETRYRLASLEPYGRRSEKEEGAPRNAARFYSAASEGGEGRGKSMGQAGRQAPRTSFYL